MRILNLIQCTNLGGMEQASLQLMIGLQERGNTCEVISLNPIGKLGPALEKNRIAAEGLPYIGRGGWRSLPALRKKLRSVSADAMIMTGHHMLAMLALGNVCAGRRLLAIHFHHTGVKSPRVWRMIYRLACRQFQAITFPSDFVRREAEALHPPLAAISHTVWNPIGLPAIPTPEQRRAARVSLGIPADARVIGNAGWLIPRKRFDVFLNVAQKVILSEPRAFFLIAGDGPERAALQNLANSLGVVDRVRWLGWQADLSQFYLSLDAMLFNTDWDALGLTSLEAVSFSVPLVASVVHGGLGEIIKDGIHGYLLPSHDVGRLTERLLTVLNNPMVAESLPREGRKLIAEMCSVSRHTDKILQLFGSMSQ